MLIPAASLDTEKELNAPVTESHRFKAPPVHGGLEPLAHQSIEPERSSMTTMSSGTGSTPIEEDPQLALQAKLRSTL
jgi:hypothetical protein